MVRGRTARTASRRLILVCGIAPALVAAVLAVFRPDPLRRLDDAVYDILLRWSDLRPPAGNIVIVDVDERSLGEIGQWPWRRDVIAELVGRLRRLDATVVAMDIIFAEPDRHVGPKSPDESAPITGIGAGDGVLADTLGDGRVVLGYAFTFEHAPVDAGRCVLHPLNLAIVQPSGQPDHSPFFQASGTICSLPSLGAAAGRSGFLNAAPDGDGILRRVPMLIEYRGRVYPSLALSAVTAAAPGREATLEISHVNAASFALDTGRVPLDGKSNLLVRYRGKKRTFPYVSAVDVLRERIPHDSFAGKIVFVGTTALGTREVVATPLDTLFTGVEVQATVADNLLQQDFMRRQEFGPVLEGVSVLKLGASVALIAAHTRMLWAGVGVVGGIGLLWWGAAWILSAHGTFLSPLLPTLGLVVGYGVIALAKSTLEGRRADDAGHEKATAQQLMVQTLLSLTEVRDAETGRHSRRTQEYTRLLANSLAVNPEYGRFLTPERVALLSSLAPLHDIGKVGVPDHILNKPGPLTEAELVEMRKHPERGRDVILKAEQQVGVKDDAILSMAKDIVYTHHERWDGTGYPQGLRGSQIPIEGRVMAVVDVYDAAVSRNLYRPPVSHAEAVAVIAQASGSHFDPAVVEAFLKIEPGFKQISDTDPL
jgi:adenylate cyclase